MISNQTEILRNKRKVKTKSYSIKKTLNLSTIVMQSYLNHKEIMTNKNSMLVEAIIVRESLSRISILKTKNIIKKYCHNNRNNLEISLIVNKKLKQISFSKVVSKMMSTILLLEI